MAQRIKQVGQTHAMELIFFPLIILILVGLIANTFQSSAIQTVPALPTPICTGNIEPGECYPTNVNGCDSSINPQCNFSSSTTFSFLNSNSPFTLLLQGNIVGFLIGVFSTGENPNVINSGYTICIPQINGVYANQSGDIIHNLQCLGYTAAGVGNHPFPSTGIPLNGTSNVGNNSVWTITGCQLQNKNYPCILNYGNGIESWNGTNAQQGFYAIYIKNGTSLTASSGCTIYGSVGVCKFLFGFAFQTSSTFTCPTTSHVNGVNINRTTYYCLMPVQNPNATATNTATPPALPNSFAGVSFLFGVLLLFLGLGVAIATALIGFTINEQGTKVAQVMGIGIVVWSFVYGEFGSWLTVLPFNLGIITFLTFTMMFFLGLYWRVFSLE